MEEAFWHMDSVQRFRFEVKDVSQPYNLSATFRNASSYPFYNLYFQFTLTDSLDNVIIDELREVHFFDPKTGEPYGSGLGDLFDHVYLLAQNHTFDEPGSYTIGLQQYMRMDTLPFILSVGARVEAATR
ncbi:MAG: hypothetical protein Tsb0034_17210 [Ekhidna sp.]